MELFAIYDKRAMDNISYQVLQSDAEVPAPYRDVRYTVISEANESQFNIFLPTFTVICLLMCIGIPGNVLTLLVYTKRLKKATARQFIMTMAACDLLTCSVVMPTELAIMSHFFEWDFRWLCKTFRWFSYSVNNISSITLLLIAIERYRLICKPWKQKLTIETSKLLCYGNVVVSIIYALPMFFIYGTQTIPLQKMQSIQLTNWTNLSAEKSNTVINGKSCLMDDHMVSAGVHFSVVTSSVYISSIVIMFLILIFLYGNVIKTLATRRAESLCQQEQKSKQNSTNRIRKITVMMIVLTVLYEVCYLPCLSVVCLRLTKPGLYGTLSKAGKVTFQLLLKSFLLCSAFNPFVYCFCNKEFMAGLLWILRSLMPQVLLRRRQSVLHTQKLVTVSQSKALNNEISMTSKAKTLETEDLL